MAIHSSPTNEANALQVGAVLKFDQRLIDAKIKRKWSETRALRAPVARRPEASCGSPQRWRSRRRCSA
jgi:hypothetical protein